MITPREIERKTMNDAKKAEAKNSIWGFYVGRPITYILTVPFLYTNISPNTITVISIVFLIGAYFCFLTAETMSKGLIALLFVFLWGLFDGVDGNLARFKNLKSKSGDLLDTLGGYLAIATVFLGMGSMAYHDLNSHMIISHEFVLEMAGLSTAFSFIPRILMHRQRASENGKTQFMQNKSSYSIPKIVVLNLCDPAGFQLHIILIAILFHLETEFTIGYFILNLSIMLYSIYQMTKE